MSTSLPHHCAVRRKSDGLWLNSHSPVKFSETIKYLPSRSRAKMIVRVDMGESLEDFEFITREEYHAKQA